MKIKEEKIHSHPEVLARIKEALATKNLVIMDFVINREEGVYPMVPAGKSTTEMLLV